MKKSRLLVLCALAVSAFALRAVADDVTVVFTSFYLTDPQMNSRNAELCGKVQGPFTAAHRVDVEVDPGPRSGSYTVLPGHDGRFCLMVQTNQGRVTGTIYTLKPAEGSQNNRGGDIPVPIYRTGTTLGVRDIR